MAFMKTKMFVCFLFLLCTIQMTVQVVASASMLKEPEYRSEKPLYLRIAVGSDDKHIIWAVLDETEGSGSGYNCAYLDLDKDNDLTDSPPIMFPISKRRSRDGRKYEAKFDFKAPVGEKRASYNLDIYTLGSSWNKDKPLDNVYFNWTITRKN